MPEGRKREERGREGGISLLGVFDYLPSPPEAFSIFSFCHNDGLRPKAGKGRSGRQWTWIGFGVGVGLCLAAKGMSSSDSGLASCLLGSTPPAHSPIRSCRLTTLKCR